MEILVAVSLAKAVTTSGPGLYSSLAYDSSVLLQGR